MACKTACDTVSTGQTGAYDATSHRQNAACPEKTLRPRRAHAPMCLSKCFCIVQAQRRWRVSVQTPTCNNTAAHHAQSRVCGVDTGADGRTFVSPNQVMIKSIRFSISNATTSPACSPMLNAQCATRLDPASICANVNDSSAGCTHATHAQHVRIVNSDD